MDTAQFSEIKNNALSLVSTTISGIDTNDDDEERIAIRGAAVIVLGKIALCQYNLNDAASEEILLRFLQLLPLKDPTEEAQMAHRILLERVANRDDFLVSVGPIAQETLLKTIHLISQADEESPEDEILDDYSKTLLSSILKK